MEMIKGFTGREGFFPKVWMSTIGLVLILGGCSGTGSSSNPQTPTINPLDRPHFTSLSPKTDESDVALNSSITIGFNKPLDPETITAASLMLLALSRVPLALLGQELGVTHLSSSSLLRFIAKNPVTPLATIPTPPTPSKT